MTTRPDSTPRRCMPRFGHGASLARCEVPRTEVLGRLPRARSTRRDRRPAPGLGRRSRATGEPPAGYWSPGGTTIAAQDHTGIRVEHRHQVQPALTSGDVGELGIDGCLGLAATTTCPSCQVSALRSQRTVVHCCIGRAVRISVRFTGSCPAQGDAHGPPSAATITVTSTTIPSRRLVPSRHRTRPGAGSSAGGFRAGNAE
jgi:hypothetical protein